MSAITDINTYVAAAVAANEAGDIDTALSKLRSARMLLVGVPDSASFEGVSLRWDRSSIDAMIVDLQKQQTSATVSRGGIRRTSVIYKNAGLDACD